MAKISTGLKKKITLKLNEQEAEYLKSLLQNPYVYLGSEDADSSSEPIHESCLREYLRLKFLRNLKRKLLLS